MKNNYRTFSILPSISKTYERYTYDQKMNASTHSFSELQCGFRKEFDAQHCLLVLVEKCCEDLYKRSHAGILLIVLSKAFDYINYELLTEKSLTYGFSLESLTFIQSYLSDRIQSVKTNPSFVDYDYIESGVLQGSMSGTLFFNILICDLLFDDIDLTNYIDDTIQHAYLWSWK